MITIIHGSHRHGIHWRVTSMLAGYLKEQGDDVKIIDLSDMDFEFCCGVQVCQDGECTYKEDTLSKIFKEGILKADCIYIVTPTYFNMPPAKLKNFIDRSNALLPVFEEKATHPLFGTWVSGEADMESIGNNSRLLHDYAEIMGWKPCDEIKQEVLLGNTELDEKRILEIAKTLHDIVR